jgi:hypothetical protein
MKIKLRITTNEGVDVEAETEFDLDFDFASKLEDLAKHLTEMYKQLETRDKFDAFEPYGIDEANDS